MLVRLIAPTLMMAIPPAAALAQEPAKPAEVEKPISRAEVSAELDTDYADLDADNDGQVTVVEISARLTKSREARIERIRKERDAAFARLDSNGDGSISRAEFDERVKLPTISEPDPKPFLNRFDTNKDGVISKPEFSAPTLANFDWMDTNKDGTLTPAERKAKGPPIPVPIPPRQAPPVGR